MATHKASNGVHWSAPFSEAVLRAMSCEVHPAASAPFQAKAAHSATRHRKRPMAEIVCR